MNAGQTSERAYSTLRARILDHGFRPGERLDPVGLADDLLISVTPVRDALHRLVGEALVESPPGEGFRLPPLDQPTLQDLIDWSGFLLGLALRRHAGGRAISLHAAPDPGDPVAHARAFGALMTGIAAEAANSELRAAIASATARLNPLRIVESEVLGDTRRELVVLTDAAAEGNLSALRRLLARYHRRRRSAAAELLRALYRARRAG